MCWAWAPNSSREDTGMEKTPLGCKKKKCTEPIRQEGQDRRYMERAREGENLSPYTERKQQREHQAAEAQLEWEEA